MKNKIIFLVDQSSYFGVEDCNYFISQLLEKGSEIKIIHFDVDILKETEYLTDKESIWNEFCWRSNSNGGISLKNALKRCIEEETSNEIIVFSDGLLPDVVEALEYVKYKEVKKPRISFKDGIPGYEVATKLIDANTKNTRLERENQIKVKFFKKTMEKESLKLLGIDLNLLNQIY